MNIAGLTPVRKSRGLLRFLRAVHGRAYPRLIGSWREPSWMFYETLLPFLGTVAFVFVYRAIGAPEHFVGYVIMGGAAAAIWANVVWMMATQLWWEKRDGNLDLYLTGPCGLGAILIGMTMGSIVMALVRATIVVVTGTLVFGVRLEVTNLGLFLGVFAVTLVALYGLGTMLASLFLMWGRSAFHLSNLLMEPVFFVSGFYFPVRAIGYWTGIAAAVIPLTLGLDALRQLMFPSVHPRLLPVGLELAILAGLAVVLSLAARAALARMEWLARAAGTLTTRE